VALGLAPRAGSLVGIHLGHADLRVVLTSLDGTVLMQQRHFLDAGDSLLLPGGVVMQ